MDAADEREQQEPDAVKPDAVKPDAVKPDAVKPDAVKPDAVKPDAVKPDAVKPDAVKPDAVKPDAVKPDAVKPDAVKPDAVKPDAVKPDAVKPDAVKPDAVKPDAVKPDAVKPDAVKPDAVKPDAVKPDAVKPDAVKPDAVKPDAVKPDAVKPDAVKPDAVKPDAVKPDAVKPDAGPGVNEKTSAPPAAEVFDYLLYGLSLPERALRATSAVVGGTIHESASLVVPQAFRTSKTYETFVQQMLDFVVRDVGRVAHETDEETPEIEGYVAKKAVSGFLDLAGMATLHVSPMTVLAIVNDVAYGSQAYLNELSAELKQAGVIDERSTIHHAADLLDAVRNASATTADAFDQPPLSVEGLTETLQQTIQKVGEVDPTKLIPQAEMQQIWDDMHEMAAREEVGILDVSSTMSLYALDKIGKVGQGALSSVTVAGNLFDRHIFEHYREGLGEIREHGLYATLSRASQPYIAAVWTNFSTEKETLTEDLLTGKLIGRVWEGVRDWFGDGERSEDESSA